MHLIELLLPLADNAGRRFPREVFDRVRDELAAEFGGVTAFRRSPAEGVWNEGAGQSRDDVVLFEVMVGSLDHAWWRAYRHELERRLAQEKLVVRATLIEEL